MQHVLFTKPKNLPFDVTLPSGSRLYDKTNKKVVGKMSDERPG